MQPLRAKRNLSCSRMQVKMKEAQTLIEKARKEGRTTLSEHESKTLLRLYGIPRSGSSRRQSRRIPQSIAEIGFPLVIKGCAPNLAHKTEQGLVRVDIRNQEEADAAFEDMLARMEGRSSSLLVQEMIKGTRELVVGMTRDPQFGPCVMFGLGGIYTEILKDVSFRVAPLEKRDALQMTQEIRGRKILEGVRGMPVADLEKLCEILVTMGRIGLEQEGRKGNRRQPSYSFGKRARGRGCPCRPGRTFQFFVITKTALPVGGSHDQDQAVDRAGVREAVPGTCGNPYGIPGFDALCVRTHRHVALPGKDKVDLFHGIDMRFDASPWFQSCYGKKTDLLERSSIKNHLRDGSPMRKIGRLQNFPVIHISHNHKKSPLRLLNSSLILLSLHAKVQEFAGALLQKEIAHLKDVLEPERPYLAVIAGAKFDTKIGPVKALHEKADRLILGGLLYNTYLSAKFGVTVEGVSKEDRDLAVDLVRLDGKQNKIIQMPYVVESDVLEGKVEGKHRTLKVAGFGEGNAARYLLDVDPTSLQAEAVREVVLSAKTIFVNAVMGLMPHFFEGSQALYRLIASNRTAKKLFGGGDTLQELKNLCPGDYLAGLDDPRTYYFTGGGSVLTAIEQGSPYKIKPVAALME
jgi:hypothetical protein